MIWGDWPSVLFIMYLFFNVDSKKQIQKCLLFKIAMQQNTC